MSDTPRTDALIHESIAKLKAAKTSSAHEIEVAEDLVFGNFINLSRQLERENRALLDERAMMVAALNGVWADACGTEKPCGHEYTCTCTMDAVKSALQKAGEIP